MRANEVTSASHLGTLMTEAATLEKWVGILVCLSLCRPPSSHHPRFEPRAARQWQHRACRKEGMCHCALDGSKHHLSSPCAATWHAWGGRTGWEQWLPPDEVQRLSKIHWVIWKYYHGFIFRVQKMKDCWIVFSRVRWAQAHSVRVRYKHCFIFVFSVNIHCIDCTKVPDTRVWSLQRSRK